MNNAAWLDGVPVDATLAANRALNYGDGVFRTMLCMDGVILDLQRHLDILREDCARLFLRCPSRRALRQAAAAATHAGDKAWVVKLTVMRRESGRGYRGGSAARLLVQRSAAPRYPASNSSHGITVAESPIRLAEQPLLAGVKHLNRLEQVLASRAWPRGIGEVILRDMHGRPVGGSRTNLFWVDGERVLHTPALNTCGVRGMMRGKVLECAGHAGIATRVADGSWAAFLRAHEIFVTNSLIGIWPVRRLAARTWRAPGPVTVQLMQVLDHPRLARQRSR